MPALFEVLSQMWSIRKYKIPIKIYGLCACANTTKKTASDLNTRLR